MKKTEFIAVIADMNGITKKDAAEMVETTFGSLAAVLATHNDVNITGFGKFEIRKRAARKGHNPQTGEKIDINASTSVGYKPSKTLKDAVK